MATRLFKESLAKYKEMGDKQVKDFRSSLGPAERKVFDQREEDLEMKILEVIQNHSEENLQQLGWQKVSPKTKVLIIWN